MQLSRKYRARTRNRIQLTLEEKELRQVEQAAESRGVPVTRFARDVLIADVTGQPDLQRREQNESIRSLLETLLSRLTKLERIQRTLVLNTAYARGYVMGAARTSPSDSRKTIEQEMAKFYDKQREFFFELYPEQRDGETQEMRS